MVLYSQADQLKLTAIKPRHWEQSMLYQSTLHHEIADILQISKSSAENDLHQLGYINHFDVLLNISKKKPKNKKTPLWLYFCMWFFNVQKHFVFKTNCDRWWKVFHTILWNGTDHGAGKMNHHQHQRLVFIQRKMMLCMWWDWKGVLWVPPGKPND